MRYLQQKIAQRAHLVLKPGQTLDQVLNSVIYQPFDYRRGDQYPPDIFIPFTEIIFHISMMIGYTGEIRPLEIEVISPSGFTSGTIRGIIQESIDKTIQESAGLLTQSSIEQIQQHKNKNTFAVLVILY